MKSKYVLSILLALFSFLIFVIGQNYINQKEEEILSEKFTNITNIFREKIDLLINEQKNSALSLTISLIENNQDLKRFILNNKELNLATTINRLKKNTSFQNIWFQVIDKNGKSLYRSWTHKKNDYIVNYRKDLQNIIKNPKITTSISVGKFDISFKSIVPIYENNQFIGLFETITHFNSIVNYLKEKDNVSSMIVVDKLYTNQLYNDSLSRIFIQNHYIPNYGINEEILNLVKLDNIATFLNISDYKVKDEYLVTNYNIENSGVKLANFLVFKKLDSIDMKDLSELKKHAFFYFGTFVFVVSLMIFTLFYYFYSRKLKSVYMKLNRSKRKLQELNENLQITIEDEVKKNEQKNKLLFQQNKMAAMGEMIENIAHQWRQPLSLITTEASSLKVKKEYDLLEDKDLMSSLDSILETSNYLSHTIDDFRNYFSPTKDKNFFNSLKLVEKCLKLVKHEFTNGKIVVIKNIKNIEINSFENELVQIIINLLNNAKDELLKIEDREKRLIFIDLYDDDLNVNIKFKDSAGGIDEDIIDRIFEPYFTTKHKSKGTGIGLYMVDQILEKHIKGSMKVKNERYEFKGQKYTGAVFTLSFPKR